MQASSIANLSATFLQLVPTDTTDERLAGAIADARCRLPYDELIAHLRNRPGFTPGPDIVLLGLPRTGTSWLFEHFHRSANTAKNPFKEINFLNFKTLLSDTYFGSAMGRRNWRVYRKQFDAQYEALLATGAADTALWALIALAGQRDWRWYDTIMGSSAGELGMDYTPSNFAMSASTAALLRLRHPKVRCAIMLRHPIERYQSHVSRFDNNTAVPLKTDSDERDDINTFLFGQRLRRLKNILGDVGIFYFSDLQADPVAFMADVCRRLGVTMQPSNTLSAPINAVKSMIPMRLTSNALTRIRRDLDYLDGIVRPGELATWKQDVEDLLRASRATGYATLDGFARAAT